MKFFKTPWLAMFAAIGLSAQIPDFTPPTPLFRAASNNDTAQVRGLLASGANPNEGRYVGFTPVFFAIINQNLEMLRAMVDKGADVQATDGIGSTTLMWAASNEKANPELVEELLKLGVNPNAANKKGETALTWAMRRGQTPIVTALTRAGASQTAQIKQSVESALALLQKSGGQFVRVSGCTSCHHQSLPQMAASLARQRGLSTNDQVAQNQVAAVVAMFKPARELMLQGTDRIPDTPVTVSYALLGLHAEGYAPDETTEAMAHVISTKQFPDGSFHALSARPPMESSDFTATALSVRALQLYGKQPEKIVAQAREWLRTSRAETTEDQAMQLLGLAWSNANSEDVRKVAQALLKEQHSDGGWSQLSTLESDAYATGQALFALHQAGQLAGNDTAYQRGVGFLLRTQFADGSWLVRSRAYPFQPYKESGFPHGKDQWISASGTSWAAMALSLALPPSKQFEGSGGQ